MQTNATPIWSGVNRRRYEHYYDYLNRRVRTETSAAVGGFWFPIRYTTFFYEGWNMIREKIYDADLGLTYYRTYAWGLDIVGSLSSSGGVQGLIAMRDSYEAKTYLPGYDANGNVAVMLDAADGSIEAAYEYSPFGEYLRKEGDYADDNPIRFSTKYTDEDTNLVYYGRRYYDPKDGRFVGRDPIEEQGGLNLYGFVENDAINSGDYLGMTGSRNFRAVGEGPGDMVHNFFTVRDRMRSPYDTVFAPFGLINFLKNNDTERTLYPLFNPGAVFANIIGQITFGGDPITSKQKSTIAAFDCGLVRKAMAGSVTALEQLSRANSAVGGAVRAARDLHEISENYDMVDSDEELGHIINGDGTIATEKIPLVGINHSLGAQVSPENIRKDYPDSVALVHTHPTSGANRNHPSGYTGDGAGGDILWSIETGKDIYVVGENGALAVFSPPSGLGMQNAVQEVLRDSLSRSPDSNVDDIAMSKLNKMGLSKRCD